MCAAQPSQPPQTAASVREMEIRDNQYHLIQIIIFPENTPKIEGLFVTKCNNEFGRSFCWMWKSKYKSQGCKSGPMKKSEIIQEVFLKIWIYDKIMLNVLKGWNFKYRCRSEIVWNQIKIWKLTSLKSQSHILWLHLRRGDVLLSTAELSNNTLWL